MKEDKETKCSYGSTLSEHCSGCTDERSEGTHQGCTIEHGHLGCDMSPHATTYTNDNSGKEDWSQCNNCFDGDHQKCSHDCRCCHLTTNSEKNSNKLVVPTHTQDGGWEQKYHERFHWIESPTFLNLTGDETREILAFIHQEITAAEERESSRVLKLRPELERLLWAEYNPEIAPNMEELLDKFYAILSPKENTDLGGKG